MSDLVNRSTFSLVLRALERREKFNLAFALVLILFGTVLEIASISLVIPVVQAVIGGDQRESYSWLPDVFQTLPYQSFVQLLLGSLVVIFVAKNVFLLMSNFLQQRIQLSISNRIQQRLFNQYLLQPYEFHLTASPATLVRNVQEYSTSVVANGTSPGLTLATEVATAVGLLGVLFVVNPIATSLLLVLFGSSTFAFLRIVRSRTRSWGAQRIIYRGRVLEALLQGFGGIKEFKLFGRQQEILVLHQNSMTQAARLSNIYSLSLGLPRAIFEVLAVLGVVLVVVGMTLQNSDLQGAATIVALFGLVAFRMLPSVNKFTQALQALSFGRFAVEEAVKNLAIPVQSIPKSECLSKDPFDTLRVEGVKYRYPDTVAVVVDVEELTLYAGESLGIVGTSGSGKSTLVDLLIGLLAPSSGHITVNGRRVDDNPRSWQDRIGYVPQHVFLMDTSVRCNVAFGLPDNAIEASEVERALRLANLWDFVQTLPKQLDTVVGDRGVRLSGGQRQRLGIARAIYGNPEVVVLDEATSALDENTEREIVEAMREVSRDRTLIVVAHRTSTLAYCSRLIRLEGGRIVQDGTFAEVIGSLPHA
jgi:ABC-type multidrug transport system fused ATPase/permease subunit